MARSVRSLGEKTVTLGDAVSAQRVEPLTTAGSIPGLRERANAQIETDTLTSHPESHT